MTNAPEAVALFRSGLNCSQAILEAYGSPAGLAAADARMLASGFGAGMRRADTCGAVTGALMVLGLHHGFDQASDAAGKARIHEKVLHFCARFEARCGSVMCRELLGCGLDQARERGLIQSLCPELVRAAAELLDELG